MALELIKGGNKPKKTRAKNKGDLEPLDCPKCGNSVFIQVVVNPQRRNLKWDKRTGSLKLRCAVTGCGTICD